MTRIQSLKLKPGDEVRLKDSGNVVRVVSVTETTAGVVIDGERNRKPPVRRFYHVEVYLSERKPS